MKQAKLRFLSILIVLALTFGPHSTGQAASEQGTVMPANAVNLAFFYRHPDNGTAVQVAQNFDVVILTHNDERFRDQMIANGFSSTIMQYLRFEAIMDPGNCTSEPIHNQVAYKPGDFCAISRDHPDWFLLDAAGNRLPAGSGYYVMDPGHPGWRAFWLARALEMQTAFGWSALFMDNVEANLGLRRNAGGLPAKYPDSASYQTAIRGFLEYLYINYARAYNRPIFANITSYRNEQDVWFSYLSFLDGALMETWSVDWVSNNNYLDKTRWEYELDWAEKTQNLGKQIILVASGNQADTNRQKFSFASYLLISNGKAAFRYARSGNYTQVWQYDNYQVDLGSPLGPRYQSGGVWRRDFTKGSVTVDPVNHTASISTNPPPTPAFTSTATTVSSPTSLPPTATPTNITPVQPTATFVPPTATALQPTITFVPPTATAIQPPVTFVPPTATASQPMVTFVPPTATASQPPVTFVPPTATASQPMVTFVPPTETAIQPTATAIQPAASTTPTGVPALARIYQEIDPALIYSSGWTTGSSVNTLGGGFKTTPRIGASVALDFSGRSFSLIYTTRNTFGNLEVYLDGQRIAVLNQNTSRVQYQRRWDYPGILPAGTHQLKLVFTGPKRTNVSVDAIIVW